MGDFPVGRIHIVREKDGQADTPVLIQTGLPEISVIVLLIAVQDGAVGADYDFPVREVGLDGRGNAVEYLYIQQAVGKLLHRFITLVIAQAVPGHMELEKAGVIRQAALRQQKAVSFLLKLFLPEMDLGIQRVLDLMGQHIPAVLIAEQSDPVETKTYQCNGNQHFMKCSGMVHLPPPICPAVLQDGSVFHLLLPTVIMAGPILF